MVAGSVCQIVIFLNAEQWRDISKDTSFSSSIVKVNRFSRFNGAYHPPIISSVYVTLDAFDFIVSLAGVPNCN